MAVQLEADNRAEFARRMDLVGHGLMSRPIEFGKQ